MAAPTPTISLRQRVSESLAALAEYDAALAAADAARKKLHALPMAPGHQHSTPFVIIDQQERSTIPDRIQRNKGPLQFFAEAPGFDSYFIGQFHIQYTVFDEWMRRKGSQMPFGLRGFTVRLPVIGKFASLTIYVTSDRKELGLQFKQEIHVGWHLLPTLTGALEQDARIPLLEYTEAIDLVAFREPDAPHDRTMAANIKRTYAEYARSLDAFEAWTEAAPKRQRLV